MCNIEIYNEDCFDTLNNRLERQSIDIILTSPPYNTNRKINLTEESIKKRGKHHPEGRYDVYLDDMTNEEYCNWSIELFNRFEKVLKPNGVVLYNISYGSENTECLFLFINSIITKTNFTVGDVIIWKKQSAIPNNVSKNKLTRICEFVIVFCRKSEFKTYNSGKTISSYLEKTGQPMYHNMFNFVEAKNNDGANNLNKATYSTELCIKLLRMYSPSKDITVYDPFMGTGTTAFACKKLGYNCFGSEISEKQVEYAKVRIGQIQPIIEKKKTLF